MQQHTSGGRRRFRKSTEVEAKTVNVAVEAGAKPLSFEDDNGELTGYEVEVLQEIDEIVEEYDFNLEAVEGDSVQIGLDAGKYALIGGGLYKTPEREESTFSLMKSMASV